MHPREPLLPMDSRSHILRAKYQSPPLPTTTSIVPFEHVINCSGAMTLIQTNGMIIPPSLLGRNENTDRCPSCLIRIKSKCFVRRLHLEQLPPRHEWRR